MEVVDVSLRIRCRIEMLFLFGYQGSTVFSEAASVRSTALRKPPSLFRHIAGADSHSNLASPTEMGRIGGD